MSASPDDDEARQTGDHSGSSSTVELTVEGMHCGSCVALVEETLSEQPGVASASVDLDSARALVEYDGSQSSLGEITAAIAEAGYSATPVSTTS
jgi:copper chaperone CopZ